MALFRVSGKVNSFHLRGKRFFPGEVVELTGDEVARLNLDFLERLVEPSSDLPVANEATAATLEDPEVKAEPLIVHPEAASKVKPKTLPKVPR